MSTPANQNIKTWEAISAEQGWNEQSKISILENFIKEIGLMGSFVKYAQEVADSENDSTKMFA